MSYVEKHLGRLRKVDLQGKSLEEWCKEHTVGHQNIGSYHIIGDNIYQLIHHREVTEDFDVFWFEPDGDIQFAVEFYNGGTCLEEVLDYGVTRVSKN